MNREDWYWQEEFLVCKLLAPWDHGFFTRAFAPQKPQDLQQFFSSDPVVKAYHAKQVHGDRLVEISEFKSDSKTSALPEADGIFSADSHTSVWTCTADCVPILIGDRQLGTVAAVHGGWRGTAKGILTKAITKFLDRNSNLRDIVVALGPAISGASYQVQTRVADQVLATIKKPVGVITDPQIGHCRLDIRLVQQQQLLEQGLTNSQMAIAPFCTFQTPEHFFSYRRNTLEYLQTEPKPNSQPPQIQWAGIKKND
jgi:polyphenol oxidase